MHQLPVLPVVIGGSSVYPASVVRDLGVWIDRSLSMSTHVTKVVAGCFAVLRQHPSLGQPGVAYRTGSVSGPDMAGLLQRCSCWTACIPA